MNQPKWVLDQIVGKAEEAYSFMKKTTVKERMLFMQSVADSIEGLGQELIDAAHEETALPHARLVGEKGRTVGQWRAYSDAVGQGRYVEACIDTKNTEKGKNDIRKCNIGIGPVLVFGASNFPFAFSTAGGDTASAIGAGCPVIIKAHPGHPRTSQLMADAITKVVGVFGWPQGVFSHFVGEYIEGSDERTGSYLTAHPGIKAVGFTGSFRAGKALFDIAKQRSEPIPVFAEMGSINPVFAFTSALEQRAEALAVEYVSSLTLDVGQFCTNPGVFIAVKGDGMDRFKIALTKTIEPLAPATMLNKGIYEHYQKNKTLLHQQAGVNVLAEAIDEGVEGQGRPKVLLVSAQVILGNTVLSEEVFGPFGIVVEAENYGEVYDFARQLKGQLTATLAATEDDLNAHLDIVDCLKDKAGRLLFNGMPTGVEVVNAMQHGGPFPASTDIRFTSVGPDAIKRFVRPISFQNWPEQMLPDELKDSNPLHILRIVDGQNTPQPL